MPRFLGRDYYNEDFTARRELSSRTSLTVPHHFKKDNNDRQTSRCSNVQELLRLNLYDDLRPYENTGDDGTFHFELEFCSKTVSSVESVEWTTRWKEFQGNYIEIIPSSNPDSEISLWDSQPSSLTEFCDVEEFYINPLEQLSKDCRYLEEPITGRQSSVGDMIPSAMLKSTAHRLGLGLNTQDLSFEDKSGLSEAMVFGKSDLHLTISGLDTDLLDAQHLSQMSDCIEKFELCCLPQIEAEELMYPVIVEESLPGSPFISHAMNRVIKEASSVCSELHPLQNSSPSIHLDKDGVEAIIEDLVVLQQPHKQAAETLLLSPVCQSQPPTFLSLNAKDCCSDESRKQKVSQATLESPLYLPSAMSSPLQTGQECVRKLQLQLLSPDRLLDQSSLLSTQDKTMLEGSIRCNEACFGGTQAMRFPEVYCQNKKDEQPDPITLATSLASSLDFGIRTGELEQSLSWDVTSSPSHPLSPSRPETLALDHTAHTVPTHRNLSFDFNSVEFVTELEIERKLLHVTDHATGFSKPSDSAKFSSNEDSAKANFCNNSTEDMKSENFVPIRNAVSSSSDRDPSSSKTNCSMHDKKHLSPSSTFTAGGSPNVDKHYHTQVPICREPSKPENISVKYITSHLPSTSSKSGLFPTKLLTTQKELDILETPTAVKRKTEEMHSPRHLVSGCRDRIGCALTEDCCEQYIQAKTITEKLEVSPTSVEDTGLADFDLHFSEEDTDLRFDSFDDAVSEEKLDKSRVSSSSSACPTFDPVDNFLMLRDFQRGSSVGLRAKGHFTEKPIRKAEASAHPGIITPMSAVPRSVNDSEQRFVGVSLTGQFLKAMQEISNQAEPHFRRLKAEGIISQNAGFMSLKTDYTRFLLKNRVARLESSCQEKSEDDIYKSVAMVHTLRCAAHMLEQSCLESAIVHLGTMQSKHTALTGALEGLRKTLFQYQFTMQQTRQLHPKVAAMCREIQHHKLCNPPPHKMLVKVHHNQPVLLKTLDSAISMDGTNAEILTAADFHKHWPRDCECILTWNQTAVDALLQTASLVVEFEANEDSSICKACHSENIHYVGLTCHVQNQHCSEMPDSTVKRSILSDRNGVAIVGSQNLIQHQQLLQLLETRHNVIVLRRDYASLGVVHHPDAVVNMYKGALLLHVKQLKEEGQLEHLMERLIAVGLQLSTIWILLHSLGDKTRNLFSRDAARKIAQLQALLANLSAAAKGFTSAYKVVLCKTAGDIAQYLYYLVTSKAVCPQDTPVETKNAALPIEMSKEEGFLLGIPCLNPFSCHLLLSRATIREIFTMSYDQLRSLLPELPDTIIQNLCRVVTMDRGLQLRPLVADKGPSQTYSRNNQSQIKRQFDTCEELSIQNQMQVETTVSDHVNSCELEGEDFLATRSECQRNMSVIQNQPDENEISDCMLSEMNRQNLPLLHSKTLCSADQSTPFLLSVQQPQKISSRFTRGPVDTYKTEDENKFEDHMKSVTSLKKQEISEHEHVSCPSVRQGFDTKFQQEHQKKSWPQSFSCHADSFPPEFHPDITLGDYGPSKNQKNEIVQYGNKKKYSLPKSSLSACSVHHCWSQPDSVVSSQQDVVIGNVSSLTTGSSQFFQDRVQMNIEESSRPVHLDKLYSAEYRFKKSCKSVPPYVSAQLNLQRNYDVQYRKHDSMSLSDEFKHSDFSNRAREAEAVDICNWSSDAKYLPKRSLNPPDRSSACTADDCCGARSDYSGLGGQREERAMNSYLLPPVKHLAPSTRSGFMDQKKSQLNDMSFASTLWLSYPAHCLKDNSMVQENELCSDQSCLSKNQFDTAEHSFSTMRRPEHSGSHTTSYSDRGFKCQTNDHVFSAEDSNFPRHTLETSKNKPPFADTPGYFGQSTQISADTNLPFNQSGFRKSVPQTSVYCKSSQDSGFCNTLDGSSTYRGMDDRWIEARQTPSTSIPSWSRPSFTEDLAATTRILLQGTSPGYLYGDHCSYSKPHTPVHRVSIGLAQPLRREGSEKVEEKMLTPLSPKPLNQPCETLSPPMDMNSRSEPKQHLGISETKLKKWATHLQLRQTQAVSSNSNANCEDGSSPSPKKKRAVETGRMLTYETVPGTGGQTKLAFR